VAVYRSVRAKGDTKTRKSRRVLKLSKRALQILKDLHKARAAERLASGERGADDALVFRREDGRPMDRWYVRREFQKITDAAGIGGDWCPRELRHSFVSLLSAHDVAIDLASRRSLIDERDRDRLSPGDPPRPDQGRRGHGQDLQD
jgi:integrase